jgi:ankyrin repeat protein
MNHYKKIIVTICLSMLITVTNAQTGEIHKAVIAGDLNKVKSLLEADSTLLEKKDSEDKTPLNLACATRQPGVANFLLDKGTDIHTKSYFYEYTPLLYATSYFAPFQDSDFELIQHLIALGSDVNIQGYNGITPLHRASQAGNLRVAKLLLDHGADPNIFDKYRGPIGYAYSSGTPLQYAIDSPNKEMVKFLVERGAKLNRKDSRGNTELHLTALMGNTDLTKFLIEHGSDVNALNNYNHTALYYAAKHGYRSVADVLIAAGAKKNTITESNYRKPEQLSARLKEGEAYIWYLEFGFAVKTKNHLLVFNPPAIDESLEAGLTNGHLNLSELAGQKITIFINDRYGEGNFENLARRMPGAEFILSKNLIASAERRDVPSYRLANPNESFSMGSIQVHTIPAVFGGMGYLVEVDGVKIFDAGRHLSDNNAINVAKFRKEIDFLKPFGPIDIAFLFIDTHNYLNEPEFEHYLYMVDQLLPKAIYLMGGNILEQLMKCTEVLKVRNIPVTFKEGNGDRFHYNHE